MKIKSHKLVTIAAKEYETLKKRVGYLEDIKMAREDVKRGRTVPAEEVFKYLGI